MNIRPLKWILFAPVLVLLLFGNGFGTDLVDPPPGQPEQKWSKVKYDPKLTDPFFKSREWSYPKHTAKCFSNLCMEKHLMKFCEAKLLDANMIDLYIEEHNPAFIETLKVQIRNGMFRCEHSGVYDSGPCTPLKGFKLTSERQELTLDKKTYRKGDVIKGRVYLEHVGEPTDPKYIEKYGRVSRTVKVYGVFKTIVE